MRAPPLLIAAGVCFVAFAAGCAPKAVNDVNPNTTSPTDAAAFNVQLGLAYLEQGNIEVARDKLERALSQNPRDPSVHTAVALLYDRLGEDRKAEQHFDTALHMRPNDPTVQNYFGVFLCKRRHYDAGEKMLKKAAASPLYQTPEVALNNAGVCVRNAGRLDAAEDYFRQATGLRPQFAEGWLQLAEVNFQRGKYPAARECLQRHLNLVRVSSTALWLALRIERAAGNAQQAEVYGRRLKTEFPNADETRLLLEQEHKSG